MWTFDSSVGGVEQRRRLMTAAVNVGACDVETDDATLTTFISSSCVFPVSFCLGLLVPGHPLLLRFTQIDHPAELAEQETTQLL